MRYRQSKKNTCVNPPVGKIDIRQAAYQDIATWDCEMEELMEDAEME